MTSLRHALGHAARGVAIAALAGCAHVVDGPARRTLYDLGPLPAPAVAAARVEAPSLVLPDIETTGALQGTALLYRLAYADSHELHSYAESRWSAPPSQLVRERLGVLLARERTVLRAGQVTAAWRSSARAPQVLRIELQEFVHHFDAPDQSHGRLRLRATLLQSGPRGDSLVMQRAFSASRPATAAEASAGVRALMQAVDDVALQITQWLRNNVMALP